MSGTQPVDANSSPPPGPTPAERARTARAEHDEVLAAGGHLLQQLALRDVDDEADLAIELDLDARVTNPRGGLQGGLLATMADIVAGRLVLAGSPPGSQVVTADLSIHFLRGLTRGPARARATVIHRGRSRAVVNVDVVDMATDDVAAVCCLAFSVFNGRPDADTDPGRSSPPGK